MAAPVSSCYEKYMLWKVAVQKNCSERERLEPSVNDDQIHHSLKLETGSVINSLTVIYSKSLKLY